MYGFRAPAQSLGVLDSEVADKLIGAATDIAVVLDGRGVIRDISVSSNLAAHDLAQWIGRPWVDTVAPDSRHKVEEFLSAGPASNAPSQRQINQTLPEGGNLMVLYSVVELPERDFRVAIGKDMSALERMQQKLINVQHQMERDYLRLRQFETRYRLLFRTAPDAIIIANRDTLQIVEANAAACELCGHTERRMLARRLPQCFPEPHRSAIVTALESLGGDQQPVNLDVAVRGADLLYAATVSSFNADNVPHVLLRLSLPVDEGADVSAPIVQQDHLHRLGVLVEQAPDALVVTDASGKVLVANTEFLDIVQSVSAATITGENLSRWLGYDNVDYQVIMNSLTEHGSLRLYNTRMRGEHGSIVEVELSAAAMETADGACFGFSIRNIGRRAEAANDSSAGNSLVRSEDQLTKLVGRVPLKELVRESTDLIEQLCIEAALRMTGNNRASAAEILGLSRQSLYVKLRRYNMD